MRNSFYKIKNGKNILKIMLVLLILSNGALWEHYHAHPHAYAAGVSPQAVTVYGQAGSFTTNTSGISATSLNTPRSSLLDSSGNLYVTDYSNNRILYYAAGSTTATRVYGQGGSFTSNTANNGGISATSLNGPTALALDSNGSLYVADDNNNRILYYVAGSTTATRVYGQGGNFTSNTANNGGVTATSLNNPNGIALDSSGNLYVADYYNNRVLYYLAGTTTATRVYGQAGLFTTTTANNGGISATSLSTPLGLTLDSGGNLYVADQGNNRALYYAAGSTTATRVYGQGGSFTTNTANNGGTSATSLNGPFDLSVDSSGNLYIADTANNRLLYYPSGTTTATRVYGQGGLFTTNTANNGGISATSLNAPFVATIDSSGNIYIGDASNNRMLKFQTSLSITMQPPASTTPGNTFAIVSGLIDVGSGAIFSDFTGSVSLAIKSGSGAAGAVLSGTTPVSAVSGVATFSNLSINLSGTGYILTSRNSGVASASTNSFTILAAVSPQAVTVYGQGGLFTTNTANNGGTTANSLGTDRNSAVDSSGNLYVLDRSNNRVLYYVAGSTTATRVYGQNGSFTTGGSNNGGLSANSLNGPTALTLDSSGNLYIADDSNNRVLYYAAGSTTATRVYGQNGSFTTNTGGVVTATSLYNPDGVAVDSSGNLYVAEYSNNRVLYYAAGSTTATSVYGQAGSFTTGTSNNGGVSANSLYTPVGVALDSSGNLYVADQNNNRVLYYAAGSTTATRVYGQNGSFTTRGSGASAISLKGCTGVAVDSSGNLYIADNSNSRVLFYPSGSTTATRVYGQGGSFTTNTGNNGGISSTSLAGPFGVTVDSSGNIYVADTGNNRLLKFQTSLSMTTQPPASTIAATSFGAVASLIDVGSGGVFSDFSGTVTVAIKSGTGTAGASLGYTTSNAAGNGIVTFTSLTINKSGTGYVLTLSSPGVGPTNTSTFTIAASPLAGYWPLNDGSGTSVQDWSPNGNTGTITGASWTIGQVNGAISFNGTSNYVSMGTPTALQFGTGSFSALAWFKTTSTGGFTRIINQGVGNYNSGFTIGLSPTCTGCISITLGGTSQATSLAAATTTAFNDGNWHQAAMVINRTANTAQLYVDGVAQTLTVLGGYCGTASGTSVNITSCTSLTATTTDPFVLGVYTGASGTFQYFNGSIDEVRLYTSVLTSQQIQTQYTNDTNPLEGYWPLNESSGTTTTDYSPNSNPGAVTGGTWTSGQVNGALTLNGSSDNVLMGSKSAFQFGTGSFTTMAWFKTSSTTVGHRILSTGVSNGSNGYYLSVNRSSCIGCVGAGVGSGGVSANSLVYGSTTSGFNDGNWHLAASVIDQVAKTAQIYVDGFAQPVSVTSGSCGTASGTTVDFSTCTTLNATGADPFTIGTGAAQFFSGGIDEVRTYDRALTSQQITNQYTSDTNPTLGGYWPFDENSGTTTADHSGNNDTGTITGASWTSGQMNSALSFNGTSNSVAMGTPAALQFGTNSFTVISWFKTSSTAGTQRMVSEGNYGWTSGYLLSVGPNSGACTGCVGGSIGGGTQANSLMFYSTASFNDGNWHQAVMVINQTISTAQIYVDGVAQAVSTQSGTCGTASGTSVNIAACTSLNATGTTPFTVGSYSGTAEYFNGKLDEPRIYGSPLSSQEVQTQYTGDVNALSEYATNASFSGTVGGTATYTLPISVGYQLTPAPGWSLSITSTTLTSGSNTLPTTASTLTSVSNTCTSTCTPTTMTNTISSFPVALPAGTTAPTAVKLFGTAVGSGTGAYTITPSISVTIPITARPGAYSSTATLTIAIGP